MIALTNTVTLSLVRIWGEIEQILKETFPRLLLEVESQMSWFSYQLSHKYPDKEWWRTHQVHELHLTEDDQVWRWQPSHTPGRSRSVPRWWCERAPGPPWQWRAMMLGGWWGWPSWRPLWWSGHTLQDRRNTLHALFYFQSSWVWFRVGHKNDFMENE